MDERQGRKSNSDSKGKRSISEQRIKSSIGEKAAPLMERKGRRCLWCVLWSKQDWEEFWRGMNGGLRSLNMLMGKIRAKATRPTRAKNTLAAPLSRTQRMMWCSWQGARCHAAIARRAHCTDVARILEKLYHLNGQTRHRNWKKSNYKTLQCLLCMSVSRHQKNRPVCGIRMMQLIKVPTPRGLLLKGGFLPAEVPSTPYDSLIIAFNKVCPSPACAQSQQ